MLEDMPGVLAMDSVDITRGLREGLVGPEESNVLEGDWKAIGDRRAVVVEEGDFEFKFGLGVASEVAGEELRTEDDTRGSEVVGERDTPLCDCELDGIVVVLEVSVPIPDAESEGIVAGDSVPEGDSETVIEGVVEVLEKTLSECVFVPVTDKLKL